MGAEVRSFCVSRTEFLDETQIASLQTSLEGDRILASPQKELFTGRAPQFAGLTKRLAFQNDNRYRHGDAQHYECFQSPDGPKFCALGRRIFSRTPSTVLIDKLD